MNMQNKNLAPQSKTRSKKVRQPVTALAMSTLMMSTLGVAPFSVSLVKADSKANLGERTNISTSVQIAAEAQGAVLNLRVGKPIALAFPDDTKYSITQGQEFVQAEVSNGLLLLNGLQVGNSMLVMESPILGTQRFLLKMSLTGAPSMEVRDFTPVISWAPTSKQSTAISMAQIPGKAFTPIYDRQLTPRLNITSVAQLKPLPITNANRGMVPNLPAILTVTTPRVSVPGGMDPLATPTAEPTFKNTLPLMGEVAIVPADSTNAVSAGENATRENITVGRGTVLEESTTTGTAQISPNVPVPSVLPADNTFYPTQSPLPANIERTVNDPSVNRPQLAVSQGMARVLAFKQNILAVFFSDENVMDARAINARTLAVTGKGAGRSTLAIFLAQSPDDVIGKAKIFNIDVYSPNSAPIVQNAFTDPIAAEAAITTALADPRIDVNVIQKPNAGLVVRLSGALRDKAEIDAAVSTAAIFVPNVISSLYTAATAPSLGEAVGGPALTNEGLLQAKLRNIFSNESIELVGLPGSTALKATVNSAAEAEAILSLLPTLDRRIQPFIVIRGAPEGGMYNPENPVLYGEDYEMTRRVREVTGISTVYIVRTARNALAVYGTVRNRTEYDRIRRYAVLLPQLQEARLSQTSTNTATSGTPVANASNTTSVSAEAPALATANGTAPVPAVAELVNLSASNSPATGYEFPTQIQMFVRMLDENAAAVRMVTVDSSVVEISRNALKNLGVELGSNALRSESITPETQTVTEIGNTAVILTNPGTVTREVSEIFTQGGFLGGNGFAGSGGFSNINPIRARINALITNGSAKILSRPNLTSIEGAEAQITIGGVRPVPSTTSTAGGGTSQTSVEFRRFGIILTMRPTVADDDTIILQVRGDVTDLDFTTGIDLNGSFIPGERVRSVDTTVTMREGDTLVLGGLITNDTRKQTSRVPILSNIPILGKLFQSKKFENNETELAIFLTPTIRRLKGSENLRESIQASPSYPKLQSLREGTDNAFGLSDAGKGGD